MREIVILRALFQLDGPMHDVGNIAIRNEPTDRLPVAVKKTLTVNIENDVFLSSDTIDRELIGKLFAAPRLYIANILSLVPIRVNLMGPH